MPLIVGSTILPYVAFIVGNWAVGVLLSGKGKVIHITKVVGYSLYPACWLNCARSVANSISTKQMISMATTDKSSVATFLVKVYWFTMMVPMNI